jgi:hypothetical protein
VRLVHIRNHFLLHDVLTFLFMSTDSKKSSLDTHITTIDTNSSSSLTDEPSSTSSKQTIPTTSGSGTNTKTNFLEVVVNKIRGRSRSPSPCPTITPQNQQRSQSPDMSQRIITQRSVSTSSTQSYSSYEPTSPMSPSSPTSPTIKRSSTQNSDKYFVGRHSNDWLFGGISVRESVRKIMGRGE